jgi:mono/diheme cytochrome c family protein
MHLRTFLAACAAAAWLGALGPLPAAAGPQTAASTASPAAATDDEYLGLPAAAGRDEVFGICGACHSVRLITQQGLPRWRWEEIMVYMVEEQEMPELDAETNKLIVDYLEKFYGPERRAQKMAR